MFGFKINKNLKAHLVRSQLPDLGTKTKFRSRANTYKSTQRKFVKKESVPKQALKQKCFHEHYCSDRYNGIEDWVII